MGAQDFTNVSQGKDAREAFNAAGDSARYEYGHGGYTGTIAEKHGFRMVDTKVYSWADGWARVRELTDYVDDAEGYLQPRHPGFWHDKWGDAGCIEIDAATVPESHLPFRGKVVYADGTEKFLSPDPRKQRWFIFFGVASS